MRNACAKMKAGIVVGCLLKVVDEREFGGHGLELR